VKDHEENGHKQIPSKMLSNPSKIPWKSKKEKQSGLEGEIQDY
jgi:hypothetical protein